MLVAKCGTGTINYVCNALIGGSSIRLASVHL